jgi:hypothetical protein
VLACSPKTYAGASNKNGNPFGNGSFFSSSGTFSAIARGNNGFLGVYQFSTSSTNTGTNNLTNSGIATVYANGQQYVGNTFGVIDPAGSTVSATYMGGYSYSEYVTIYRTNITTVETEVGTNVYTTNVTPNAFNAPIFSNTITTNYQIDNFTSVTNDGMGGPPTTNYYSFTNITLRNTQITIGNTNTFVTNITAQTLFLSNNISYVTNVTPTTTLNQYSNTLSGQFTATLKNSYPNQIFSGSGQATVLNLVDGTRDNYQNSVQGSRVSQ